VLPTSLIALGIILVAVFPGAVYTWAFEREAGSYGVTLADRTLRFLAASTVIHLLFAWPEYLVFRIAIEGRDQILAGQFALLWLVLLLLSVIPALAGTVLGGLYATRTTRTSWPKLRRSLTVERERRLLHILLGRDPAPRPPSPPASRPRSSPSGSGTPASPSPWTPTATSSPAWTPRPPARWRG
jgi:hypothetical protein